MLYANVRLQHANIIESLKIPKPYNKNLYFINKMCLGTCNDNVILTI